MPSVANWRFLRRRRSRLISQHNAANSHLYKMPAELLVIISQHLDSEDASIALAFTCARFFYSDALKGVMSSKAARFKGLCMLEDGGEIKGYCCQGCLVIHSSSAAFSQQELEKRPSERCCLLTKKCLKLGIYADFSFVDIKKLVSEAQGSRQGNRFTKLFSSPQITLTFSIRIFPRSKLVTLFGFKAICEKLNFALCPHMPLSNYGIFGLFRPKWGGLIPVWGWPDGSYKCTLCKTQVSLGVLPSNTPGNGGQEWCVVNVSRSVGRLYSPLEPAWLEQTFGSKYSRLDEYNKVTDDWFQDLWGRNAPRYVTGDSSLKDLGYRQPYKPHITLLFDPTTLTAPDTLASWVEGLGVKAWMFASGRVPESIHRICGPPHTIEISAWAGPIVAQRK